MKSFAFLLILLGIVTSSFSQVPLGDKVPNFTATDQDGSKWVLKKELKSADYLVVYFYPVAFTSGCTAQACSYRDQKGDLETVGAQVVGVSGDKPETLELFALEHNLNFTLLADPEGFAKLEAIVHPMVRDVERRFLQAEAARGSEVAVLEIPLLLDTGADELVDVVIVVSTDAQTQANRVLERPNMSREKLAQLLSRQLPDAQKRARADFVVETGGTVSQSQAKLDSIIESLRGRSGVAYQRHCA